MNYIENKIEKELKQLNESGDFRYLPNIKHDGKFISAYINGKERTMLNLSSNDYLGIASDKNIQEDFIEKNNINEYSLTSSSSRLLTGNFSIYTETEGLIARKFGKESALLFSSGYQMNTGILPAITDKNTLILADKLVHASIIDGIRLSSSQCIRYRHMDYEQIEMLVKKYYNKFNSIIIVTESVFSMDGDITDLKRLIAIKKSYHSVMLYVDEAHGIGVRGDRGLGVAEEQDCINEIDFLCGTLGKALASAGAYVVCSKNIKEYLVNKMRSFIFTTALPPLNIAWTKYLFSRLEEFDGRREHLSVISKLLINKIRSYNVDCVSDSHIVPLILGCNDKAIYGASYMQNEGFYVLPIRQPTVPAGTERLRLSLSANITVKEANKINNAIDYLIHSI